MPSHDTQKVCYAYVMKELLSRHVHLPSFHILVGHKIIFYGKFLNIFEIKFPMVQPWGIGSFIHLFNGEKLSQNNITSNIPCIREKSDTSKAQMPPLRLPL